MHDNSTYCSLSTSAWDDRNKSMCCFADLPKFENFKQMHDSKEVKQLIQDLKKGIKNPICKICWDTEESGMVSMRQQSLRNEHRQKTESDFTKEIAENKLKYLVFDTGSQCNFACRTCGPWSSTGHAKEWKEKHGQDWQQKVVDLNAILDQDLSEVKNIEVLGGEPFVNLAHLKVIDKIKDSNPYWLTYTTNGSVKLRQEILDKFKHFKAVNICLSIDATGKPFEYIRTLGKWESVESNIDSLLQQKLTYKNLSVNCHITVSALNILYLKDLLDWCDSKKLTYDFTYAYYPNEYSFDIFDDNEKQEIKNILTNDPRCNPLISYLDKANFDNKERVQFKESVEFTKKYRKLDLKEYLPRLYNLVM